MQKKYTTLKTLAAFTALAGSTIPLYSQAQVNPLPSVELNFDVLQKLNQNEKINVPVKNEKKLQPELNNANRIVAPTPKPEIIEPAKEDAPKVQPLAEPEQAERLPIIIRKDTTTEETATEQELQAPTEQKKSIFSGIGDFLSKAPFFNKSEDSSSNEPAVSNETAKTEVAVESDTYSDKVKENVSSNTKAQEAKKNKHSANKKPIKKKKPEKKTIHPAKTKDLPKPHLKEETNVVAVKEKLPIKLEAKPENAILNDAINIAPSPQEKLPHVNLPTKEEKKPQIIKPAPKEEVKKPEPEIDKTPEPVIVAPVIEEPKKLAIEPKKVEAASENMWEKFLDNAKNKTFQASQEPVKSEDTEINQNSIVSNKPDSLAKAPAPAPTPAPKSNINKPEAPVSQQAEKPAEKPIEQKEKPIEVAEEPKAIKPSITQNVKKETEAVSTSSRAIESKELEPAGNNNSASSGEISKSESGLFSSLMESMPSFGSKKTNVIADADKNKIPVTPTIDKPSSSIEDKLAESKRILDEKTKDATEAPIPVIPPVPEASIPMEIKDISAPENTQVSNIKDAEKPKDLTKEQPASDTKAILLSIAFDGNNTEISEADKENINKLVKQILSSSKRLKVMSYAQGIDGEVNSSRRISLQRAIAIRMQMIQDGLEKTRINVQAIGNNTTDQEFANSANIYIVE